MKLILRRLLNRARAALRGWTPTELAVLAAGLVMVFALGGPRAVITLVFVAGIVAVAVNLWGLLSDV